eukprot:11317387-Prorocentrum_lima.AAC.1
MGPGGEHYGTTFYDRATGQTECGSVRDKTADSVVTFLAALTCRSETRRLDGAPGPGAALA